MKFNISFKTPDASERAASENAYNLADLTVDDFDGMSDEETEQVLEQKEKEIEEFLEAWISYGEYITIEFDTEAKTATVRRSNP
jgi:hypothetical protein